MQEYNLADNWLHQASQHLARINKAFQPQKADDSHTTLHFDPINQWLSAHWIQTQQEAFLPVLDLQRPRLQWLNQQLDVVASFELNTPFEPKQTDLFLALNSALPNAELSERMHYEIPDYADNTSIPSSTALSIWKNNRKLALDASYEIIRFLGLEATVHIWPHHFDTGIFIPIKGSQSLGFGLAMADSMKIGPYFYMSSYDEDGMINPKVLRTRALNQGNWILEGSWTGTVLRLKLLETSKNATALLNHWIQNSLYSFLSFKK